MSVPPDILAFHRALLSALRLDYFPPGMGDVNAWHDFLWVLDSIKDSAGGPLTERDIAAAVKLMREQNRNGESKWSLRFSKILRDPEAFRDLVLIARKAARPRPAPQRVQEKTGDGANILVERTPEKAPARVEEILRDAQLRRLMDYRG